MHKNKNNSQRKNQFKKVIFSAVTLVVIASFALLQPARSIAAAPTITEFTSPSNMSIWGGITKGPDGNVWYIENGDNKIAKITPGGVSTDYSITTSSSDPRFIAAGADGNLWFTEYGANQVAKITPTGTVTEYPVTTTAAGAFAITAGPDGNMWFSEVAGGIDQIAKITPSGTVTEFPISVQPFGIATGPDGNLWVAAPNDNVIAKITPTGTETDYTVPTSSSANTYITAGPDGNMWFTERDGNKVAKVTTSGSFTEYTIPTATSDPAGITTGPDGRLWFTEATANKIGSVTTTGSFTELDIPTASSQSVDITAGADGNIWFTELGILTNKVGKVTLPLAPDISNSSVTAFSGTAKTFNLVSGVANNPAASTLAITLAGGPGHGTATVNTTAGTITYTAASGFVGSDSITYTLCSADDTGQCATAALGISVTAAPPDTGFGVSNSSPLRTLAIFGLSAGTLLGAALLSRKYLKN